MSELVNILELPGLEYGRDLPQAIGNAGLFVVSHVHEDLRQVVASKGEHFRHIRHGELQLELPGRALFEHRAGIPLSLLGHFERLDQGRGNGN